MRCFGSYLVLLFSCIISIAALPTFANNSLVVTDLKIIERYYSKIILKASFSYDGSLGDSNFFGADAQTNIRVSGSSFHPYRISKGNSEIQFSLTRPSTKSLNGFKSQSIIFTLYNHEKSIKKTVDFEIDWTSFEKFFDIDNTIANKYLFSSIKSLTINENMENSKELIRDIVMSGVEPEDVTLVYIENYNNSKLLPSFEFAETINFEDFAHLIKITKKNNIKLTNVAFINLNSSDFKLGHLDIMAADTAPTHTVTNEEITTTIKNKNFDDLFKKIQFSPTSKKQLNKALLDKAIALNNEGGKKRGLKAKGITEYLISIGYDNSRIYAELARAYGRIYNYNQTAIQKRKSILNLALSIYPNDQWAHALLIFDETNIGNFEDAEQHAILAKKYEKEKNIWTIVNWGRLYEKQGRLEKAKEKYQELLGQKDLNDSNIAAHKRGLIYYSQLLENEGSRGVEKVYRELISAYPKEEYCTKVKLAYNLLINEDDYSEVMPLLGNNSIKTCENSNRVFALLKLRNWYKSGAKIAIQPIIIEHGDLTNLIYEIASMPEGHEILAIFEEKNINLAAKNQNSLNALHLSVASKNKNAIINMLNTKIDVNSLLPNGWTPLIIAAYVNAPSIVELLLQHGANKSMKTIEGYTALYIAKEGNFKDVITLLESEQF